MKNVFSGRGLGLVLAAAALLSASCVASAPQDGNEAQAVEVPTAEPAAVALRIERAARALDRGEDAAHARTEIEAVLSDPTATAAERDDATLVLSRALEALGDSEGAISSIERLLAAHAGDREWAGAPKAERRLRKLLLGNEEPPRSRKFEVHGPVPPFASILVPFFPADASGHRDFRMLAFGGRSAVSAKLGTFNVEDAIQQAARKDCPDCEKNLSSTVDHASWIGIPMHRAALAKSLVVFYYDLEDSRIPARYDADLPLPTAEINARLARGEGVLAAKTRPGAPPVLLIAAPRAAQLDNVEEALSKMEELPSAPQSITLDGSLEAEEIQEVVRASFAEFRQCYETLLQTSAAAAGKISLSFSIDPSGHPGNVKATGDAPVASMESCMESAALKLVFPAAPKMTTVVYPVMFSPG